MTSPSQLYMGFADALARELPSPEARWYADQLIGGDPKNLYRSKGFTLYRILDRQTRPTGGPQGPCAQYFALLPDAGSR